MTSPVAVGVIGGSGFYDLLDDAEPVVVETPYGAPSDRLIVGDLHGTRVVFVPRHGRQHQLPPHRIPYRANIWALRQLGVTRIIAPCASGSLRRDVEPGMFVVCDQYVDRTSGRPDTFYDDAPVTHVSAADPYCPSLRAMIVAAARGLSIPVADGGTMVVVSGPRFSTRAESAWFAGMGWSVINMTGYPEAHLARELGLCYANVSLITDFDVGVEDERPVSARSVTEVFRLNIDRIRDVLFTLIPQVGAAPPDDPCRRALEGAQL